MRLAEIQLKVAHLREIAKEIGAVDIPTLTEELNHLLNYSAHDQDYRDEILSSLSLTKLFTTLYHYSNYNLRG